MDGGQPCLLTLHDPSSTMHIGIDYSGRETPTSRTPALQVYAAFDTEEPRRILSPASTEKTYKNWCRKEIAEWLVEQARRPSHSSPGSTTASRSRSITLSVTSSRRGQNSSTISASIGRPIKNTPMSISSVIAKKARQIALARTKISG